MIYFMRSAATGNRVKIGFTEREPEVRAKEFQLPNCKVLATMEGDRQTEKRLFHRFRKWRINPTSEWFEAGPELMQYIDNLKGEPHSDVWRAVDKVWKIALTMPFLLLLSGCQGNVLPYVGGGLGLLLLLVLIGASASQADYTPPPPRILKWIMTDEGRPIFLTGKERQQGTYAHQVCIPDLGLIFDTQDGVVALDERLAKPEMVRRILAGASGWPRFVDNEPEPLAMLEAPDGDWLPVLEEWEVADDSV